MKDRYLGFIDLERGCEAFTRRDPDALYLISKYDKIMPSDF